VRDNRIHVAFCDARDDTLYGNHNALFYKRGIISGPDAIEENEPSMASGFEFFCYPNPFNSQTLLTLTNVKEGEAEIEIYDITGRLVRTSKKSGMKGGDVKIVWDATAASGKTVSSGIYFARARTPQSQKTIKLLLLK
jgi:hypothetical protein